MSLETFLSQKEKSLQSLIETRKTAFQNAQELKIQLFSEKFWDLLALYQGQWHYITTIKR